MSGGHQTDSVIYDLKTGDPVSPEEGQTWYNAGEDHLKARTDVKTVRITERLTTVVAVQPQRVPTSGTLYLFVGGVATSLVPMTVTDDDTVLRVMSLTTDASDPNPYDVEVLVNTALAATMTLSAGTTHKSDSFSLALTSGDEVQFRLRRASGVGRSSFRSSTLKAVFGE